MLMTKPIFRENTRCYIFFPDSFHIFFPQEFPLAVTTTPNVRHISIVGHIPRRFLTFSVVCHILRSFLSSQHCHILRHFFFISDARNIFRQFC